MPLLMCPNCQAGMKELNREGVMLDMCPECHGVWLDRGELQKLLDVARQDAPAAEAPQAMPQPAPLPGPLAPQPGYVQQHVPPHQPQPGWHRHHDDSDDPYKKHGGGYYGGYRKKSKLERIFDMFD